MRYWLKVLALVASAVGLLAIGFVAGAVLQPTPILKTWICITERNVARKQIRLGQMLRQGMKPDEVKAILGNPSRAEDVGSESRREGVRWSYWDGVSCAGFDLIVEFRGGGAAGPLREGKVCYVHQCADLHFVYPHTDPQYFTIGVPLER